MEKLNELELRVLGCLIEKELTTPEYYPLSLSALVSACNQKSNRHPVTAFDQEDVARGLELLREKELARRVQTAGGRVAKYAHNLRERLPVAPAHVAILCELMLRGPQTPGELRNRANRMYAFEGLDDVNAALDELSAGENPRVVKLPRQPGQKEARYAHLLGTEDPFLLAEQESPAEPAVVKIRKDDERLHGLEQEVAKLRGDLDDLKKAFEAFKAEFG